MIPFLLLYRVSKKKVKRRREIRWSYLFASKFVLSFFFWGAKDVKKVEFSLRDSRTQTSSDVSTTLLKTLC
jgi:hypothetical protein